MKQFQKNHIFLRVINVNTISEKILEYYGYENIRRTNKEIRCARGDDSNPTSIRIKLNENLTSQDFARNVSGDIFTLIMAHKNMEFKTSYPISKGMLPDRPP